jgi:DNA repair exonuclease SbcCD nuclease subunit
MKLLLTGDFHLSDKIPSCRIDDYQEAMWKKINFIQETAVEYRTKAIIQPGDLTDNPFLSYSFYKKLYNEICFPIYTVMGQHDLRYRTKGNTTLNALNETSNWITILDKIPTIIEMSNVHIYGCSYNEPIPQIQDSNMFNILVIHKMILAKKEADWQNDYELGNKFLADHDFDMIVSGDNHQSFMFKENKIGKKKKHLFNCGSLMRSTIEQIDHKPVIYIFDTDTRTYEQIFIPIKPWKECFDLETKVKEEIKNEKMEKFISSLPKLRKKDTGLLFMDNVYAYLKQNKIGNEIKEIIDKCKESRKK